MSHVLEVSHAVSFHLLEEYDHQVFCQHEIRDVRGVMESAMWGIDLFYKHFPMDLGNRSYLDTLMPAFNRLEQTVDMWEVMMVSLSKKEARTKLNS